MIKDRPRRHFSVTKLDSKDFIMLFRIVLPIFFLLYVEVDAEYIVSFLGCQLPKGLKEEIQGYQPLVNKIIEEATRGRYSGIFYNDLSNFVDRFGNRLSGTDNLEESIKYAKLKAASEGLSVQMEPVEVPYWVRGEEAAFLITPRKKKMKILGLGYSPGTGANGITSKVVVVSDFKDLERKAEEVKGKIVLFNPEFTDYGATVQYRSQGPSRASKLGAVAALIRSITPFSIDSPHTGTTNFSPEDRKIPAAAVTLEDADLISRLYNAGNEVTIYLYMEATLKENRISHNLLADIVGETLFDHYVILSGHIDSWDVGQGALDDGVGAFLALHSLYLLNYLRVPSPKRTMRAILWTGEELGLIGAVAHSRKHENELKNWTAAMESDYGSYTPLGLHFHGSEDAYCIMKEVASLFKNLNATEVIPTESAGSDITVFKNYGVPLIDPYSVPNNYMWFHHTDGDSMRTMNSSHLDKNLALFAGVSYILANLSIQLPREDQTIWKK